jgi:hypothetical protein
VYRTKSPRYGLLVFGSEAKDRVWLVLDGKTLHVDRAGNGDLTAAGNKIAVKKDQNNDPETDGFTFEVGDVSVGGRRHNGMTVGFIPLKRYADGSLGKRADVKEALAKDPKALAVSVCMDVDVPGLKGGGLGGRVSYFAGPIDLGGVFQLADKPGAAPVVHLGGPLQVTFYSELPSLHVGRGTDFVLVVGTPGVGPGTFAEVGYQDTIPEDAKPVVELSLPAKAGGALPKDSQVIKSRC